MTDLHSNQNTNLIEAINDHLDLFVEEEDLIVFHETDDDIVHTDIYWIKPNSKYRPYSILLSCGLATKPMNVPKDLDSFAEVAMLLPKNWELGNGAWKIGSIGWPINHLRKIAKTPYKNDSWVGFGHTFSYDLDENKCFPNTGFNSSILLSSFKLPAKFQKIKYNNNQIRVYNVIPLYPEELKFKLNNSANELIDKFIEFQIDEVFNPNRINTCL